MYDLSVYPITSALWRWEIRCGGALLRCGTAPTWDDATIQLDPYRPELMREVCLATRPEGMRKPTIPAL